LHLLALAAVPLATTQGHAPALCGYPIPAQGLTITSGPLGKLCTACLAGITGEHPLSTTLQRLASHQSADQDMSAAEPIDHPDSTRSPS
jgi:hypothetical protein